MPLIVDAATEKSPPMLTCVQVNDGYQFELMIRLPADAEPVTKIRIGPFYFREQYQPRPILGGLLTVGGPENAFWMHKSSPPRWSRIGWEVLMNEPETPAYLTWTGNLEPGGVGVFRFISLFLPGGLRQGLTLFSGVVGDRIERYGVTGPNYEKFERHEHH